MKIFGTIIADPPWPYSGIAVVGTGGRGAMNGRAAQLRQVGAKGYYKTMPILDLMALPVASFAAPKSHLYLWVTNSFLQEAHRIARAWGFTPKTLLTWGKVKKLNPAQSSMKTGAYFRSATEHILFCTRGNLRTTQQPCRPTLYLLPREPHSCKPSFFYELAEEQSPGPRLEMFARGTRSGWECWGNEVISTIQIQ